MPRPRLDPAFVAAHKRRRIAGAMAELCAEHGYRAATVDHVARRARVSRMTVYEHFENREDVFLAALDRGLEQLLDRTESACAAAKDSEGIEAGLAAILDWVAEQPDLAWVCFVEALCATPESMRRYLGATTRFAALLHAAAPSEVPRPATVEESLVGGAAALISSLVRTGQTGRAPQMLAELTVFLRGPFLAVDSP